MADEWKSRALVAAEQPRDPSPSDLEISRRISHEIAAKPIALGESGTLPISTAAPVRFSTVAMARTRMSTAVTNYDFNAASLIVTLT